MRGKLAIALAVTTTMLVVVPAVRGQDTPEERIRRDQARDYSLAELRQMLADVPPEPIFCATGIRWFNFAYVAPHTPKTVAALRQLYGETENKRNRRLVLAALSQEDMPELRSFWQTLLAQRTHPTDWLPFIATGLVKTGTTEDVQALTRRLGESNNLDLALLQALEKRPVAAVRPAVLARFRDRKAPAGTRVAALRALLQLREGREAVLNEALSDPAAAVRAEAVGALSARSGTDLVPQLKRMLNDPAAEVRRPAVKALAGRAVEADLPLFLALLNDPDDQVRSTAEGSVISGFQPQANFGSPFSTVPDGENLHFRKLLEMTRDAQSPLHTSPAILLELGKWVERRGDLSAAKRLYVRAAEAGRKRKPSAASGWDAGATSLFQLARLEFLTGNRADALKHADELAAAEAATEAYMQDYPLPGETMVVKARELGERLRKDFTSSPFAVSLEAIPQPAPQEGTLTLRTRIRNVSADPQQLVFRRTPSGESMPAMEASLILAGRHWTSATPDFSQGAGQTVKVVQPGQSVRLELSGSFPQQLREPSRVDLILQVETVTAEGSKKLWLRGVTSVERK